MQNGANESKIYKYTSYIKTDKSKLNCMTRLLFLKGKLHNKYGDVIWCCYGAL